MPPKNTNGERGDDYAYEQRSREKAVWKASAMELDWTILPMNPSAMMMEMEKKAASFYCRGPLRW